MKTTLQFKDMQIFGKESDPKEAIIDYDFDLNKSTITKSHLIDLIKTQASKSYISFQCSINKIEIEYENGVIDILDDIDPKIYFNGSLEYAIANGLSVDHLMIDFNEDENDITVWIGRLDS
tara:strand:- start:3687 stop:4049 length:363 start_codon:yes stop_codon:yes gene_type:complete